MGRNREKEATPKRTQAPMQKGSNFAGRVTNKPPVTALQTSKAEKRGYFALLTVPFMVRVLLMRRDTAAWI
jgi:hypothetical protein